MLNPVNGYTYQDAVFALMESPKFYPSETGLWEDCKWVDDRPRPSSEEVANKLAELKLVEPLFYLRQERDKRLAACDLWGLKDYPTTEAQAAYRQALRDITNTYKSLDEVVWPDKPV